MNIESITNNTLLKNMLLKQLKKVVKENNIKLITIEQDENDKNELDFKVYYEDQKIMPLTEFKDLLKNIIG